MQLLKAKCRRAAGALAVMAIALGAAPPTPDSEAARARQLAGTDFADSLFLCEPNNPRIADMLASGPAWFPPMQAFDNLWYIGNSFVGAWVLNTGQGLILIDAMQSEAEAREHLEPGLRALGFEPSDIRYVLVTHGHWDHYGGATYLQKRYGARIGLSAADWNLMETSEPGSLARAPYFGKDTADRPPPELDLVIEDGQKVRLGDTVIQLFVTPGHSPGTLSMLIPVREGRRTHVLSLLGGTAFPRTLEPDGVMGGLNAFDRSVERLSQLSRRAGAVGTINTHVFVDGGDKKLAQIALKKGGANPFVIGAAKVTRYYAMFRACLGAAKLRPQDPNAGPPMPSKQ
jgi:metallo-beta-lactamase class B